MLIADLGDGLTRKFVMHANGTKLARGFAADAPTGSNEKLLFFYAVTDAV